jgi:hypothetical protein
MTEEGPILETLTRRLTECPAEFQAEPLDSRGKGSIDIAALVFDLIRDLGGTPPAPVRLLSFKTKGKPSQSERNRLQLIAIACWLFHDPWFLFKRRFGEPVLLTLEKKLDLIAATVHADKFISDPDRREELARACLMNLGLRPAGESEEQAADRLTTLDSVERARVIKETRAAEERARKIREELARKAAEEAAATYGRE